MMENQDMIVAQIRRALQSLHWANEDVERLKVNGSGAQVRHKARALEHLNEGLYMLNFLVEFLGKKEPAE